MQKKTCICFDLIKKFNRDGVDKLTECSMILKNLKLTIENEKVEKSKNMKEDFEEKIVCQKHWTW